MLLHFHKVFIWWPPVLYLGIPAWYIFRNSIVKYHHIDLLVICIDILNSNIIPVHHLNELGIFKGDRWYYCYSSLLYILGYLWHKPSITVSITVVFNSHIFFLSIYFEIVKPLYVLHISFCSSWLLFLKHFSRV